MSIQNRFHAKLVGGSTVAKIVHFKKVSKFDVHAYGKLLELKG